MAYAYQRTFTVDHTKVGGSNSTGFPVLITGTITAFKTVGNSGHIQNTVSFNGVTVPADINFYSDAGRTTAIPFEIAAYSATTGQIEIWAKITISHTVDTVIYCAYDDAAVTTYQGGAIGDAWDSNHTAVYHFGDGTTLSLVDSTSNGNTLTNNDAARATAVAGQIDGGVNFNTTPGNVSLGRTSSLTGFAAINASNQTLSMWLNAFDNVGSYSALIIEQSGSSANDIFIASSNLSITQWGGAATVQATAPSSGAWHHVAWTWNGTTNTLYIDGVSAATSSTGLQSGTVDKIYISTYNGSDQQFPGKVDEVRVEKTTRSADWVLASFNNQSSPSTFITDSGESSIGGAFPDDNWNWPPSFNQDPNTTVFS